MPPHENENILTDPSQEEKNLEVLGKSELGVFLERAYLDAVNLDPRLSEIDIVPMSEGESLVAACIPAWASETGRHTVRLRLGLDDALASHQEVLDKVPGARELFAAKMGLQPDEVSAPALHVFSMLHEMGHITEFMDYDGNPDELKSRQRREKQALPIGNGAVSAMMTEGTNAHRFILDNWDAIQLKYGVASIGELLTLQHEAHRNMTSERIADNFAADVFVVDPSLKDSLIQPDVVSGYRNYNSVNGTP